MNILKLSKLKIRKTGRNSFGKIIAYHRGGGVRRKYRFLDFYRNFFGKFSIVRGIFYDPNRRAFIALICFRNGLLSYIISQYKLKLGDLIITDFFFKLNFLTNIGNRLLIENIPTGTFISCVQYQLNSFAKLARSAGSCCQVIRFLDNNLVILKLRSKKFLVISSRVFATIGIISNSVFKFFKLLKAGNLRRKGYRPIVRGVAMNPVDHPHGGGEGKSSPGRVSVSPWGFITKNHYRKLKKKKIKF